MRPEQIKVAEDALIQLDQVLGRVIARQRPVSPRARTGVFESLCRTIIGQQMSVVSAAAIYGRFEIETKLDPKRVAELAETQMKQIGLSRQKLGYLHDLGAHFVAKPDIYDHLGGLDDETVITELTQIKGIGVWTAQMFLMFTLGREDIFAPDDVGLQNAIKRIYGLDEVPKKAQLSVIAQTWAPYRSTASLHLWKSLHNEPV